MAKKAKHAFGNLADVQAALSAGKIDAYDILFLDGDTEPKVGWIDAKGVFRLVESEADFSELEAVIATKANVADVEALETELATKASTEEVEVQISESAQNTVDAAKAYTDGKVEAAISEHLTKKYEITGTPEGTLIKMNENEIRICCPANAKYSLQSVGEGGDVNTYYVTLKTYIYDDNVVGYIEHLGDQVDGEILTDLKTDEYGRRYQPTWLGVAKYDSSTDSWAYYGSNSTGNHYIGWDYQLDLYDANGVMIGSDSIRINLSNEDCHSLIEPYYMGEMKVKITKDIDTIIEEKVAEVEAAYEVIEF